MTPTCCLTAGSHPTANSSVPTKPSAVKPAIYPLEKVELGTVCHVTLLPGVYNWVFGSSPEGCIESFCAENTQLADASQPCSRLSVSHAPVGHSIRRLCAGFTMTIQLLNSLTVDLDWPECPVDAHRKMVKT